ncbi:phosphatase [Philodulcilactobacillus myokoensis]|uniref:Phosphatase n=1 Tax=Philodulcilactobacillus myokoensis TaxID=2929573 RepID=A0A9W6B168_9LACO|nr:phosphatase PAP2 family protein [Philodulcilactobacillus myokoensis]GLB46590.1 phosphatase [Philodulcilactobacillus myokoensis]
MLIYKEWDSRLRFWIALIFSVALTVFVMFNSGYLQFLDSMFTADVQKNESGLKEGFYNLITMIANPKMDILWILIIAFILWGFKYKVYALWSVCTIIGSDVFGAIIKMIVRRPRPLLHLAKDKGFSFPSMHVFGMMIVISVIWILVVPFIKRQWLQWVVKIAGIIMVLLVMMSRIYLNAHFPTDTLGGVLLGYLWLQICEFLYIKFAPKINYLSVFSHNIM